MIGTRFHDVLVVGHPADRRKWKELVSMVSRPHAALASLFLTILGVVFLFPDCASACSCAILGSQEERAERALAKSSALFSGEVVDFKESASPATATVRVAEVWKGPKQRTIEITTPSVETMCGYPFKEGQEYLVYAYTGKQGLEVDLCSETIPLSKASTDLEVLGAGKKPTGGEVLSDTSGGLSAGALVGLAGLALAASLVVVVRLVRTG
jgi:hypothetical protein